MFFFYFSRRNYRETSALLVCCSGSRLYFQQCVTRHALTPAVYFCNVYSPCKNKKYPTARAAGCRGGSRMREIIPTTAREATSKKLRGLVILLSRGSHTPVWRMRKEKSALNLFVRVAISVCEHFPKNSKKKKKKIGPLTLSRLFLTNNMYRLFIIK